MSVLALACCTACSLGRTEGTKGTPPHTPEPKYPTLVNPPTRLEAVDTGETDALGKPVTVRCETCHALRTDDAVPGSEQLTHFHQSLTLQHGMLTCQSCHAVGQPPKLKLADGSLLPTSEAIRLCAQCHGVQYENYQHGAHGGMTGYWDLSQGPRLRNHCIDCHAPHTPAIRPVHPKPPPRDRFFGAGAEH